ncbi:MAG: PAS domain S-box protein [Acidobacteria bacterium]|nr:PAS domain S-box protein [Acidobacteriota bacterium]
MGDHVLTTARILILHAQEAEVRLLDQMLRAAGFSQVIGTIDPAFLDHFHGQPPDLVLLGLPPGDSLALLKRLAPPRDVPVLILTGGAAAEWKQQALALGAADFLALPPDPREVLARVRSLLELRFLRREIAAHDQAVQYQTLFDNNPLPMWLFDPETLAFAAVNQAAIRHYGYSRDEFQSLTLADIVPPEDVPALRAAVRRPRGRAVSFGPVRHRKKDGSLLQVDITSLNVEFGNRPVRLAALEDVTERWRIGLELQEKTARLRELAHALDLAQVVVRGLDGTIRLWSLGAERLYGWTAREALGKVTHQLFRTEFPEPLERIDRELLAQGHWEGDLKHIRRDWSVVWVASHWSLHRDSVIEVNTAITGRKRAEEQLLREKRFTEMIVNSSFDGIVAVDRELRCTLMNPAMERILGQPKEQCLGARASDLMPALVESGQAERILARLEGGPDAGDEQPFQIPLTGRQAWIEARRAALRDESGEIIGLISFVRDVTGRMLAHDKLREDQQRLELVIQASNIAFADLDLATNQAYFSPESRERLGLEARDSSAMLAEWQSRLHPEDFKRLTDAFNAYFANPSGVLENEYRLRHKDGSYRWWLRRVTALCGEDGKPCRLLSSHLDITGRKQAEQELRESQERLSLAVQASRIGFWDWNVQTNEVYFSPEYKGQLGYADHEFPNRLEEAESRVYPGDRGRLVSTTKAYLQHPGPNYQVEFRMRHRDGSYRWMQTGATLLRDAQGKPHRMLGSHLDITERKLAEEQLRELAGRLQAAREEQRALIARELHDELGQLLTAVKMDVARLAQRLPPGAAGSRKNTQLTLDLVDTTIQAVRNISTGLRPGVLDLGLAAALEWQAQEFAARTGISCRLELPAQEVDLAPDRSTALFRIFQETLANIAGHSGAVQVEARLELRDGEILLEVRDDGKGIPKEALESRKSLGILGMRERALLLGGEFSIERQPDRGTLVRTRIPLRPGASRE